MATKPPPYPKPPRPPAEPPRPQPSSSISCREQLSETGRLERVVEPAPGLVVTLNTAGVLAPVERAIRQTVDVVTFCLNAIEQGDLSDWPNTDLMRFTLKFADQMSAEQRKAAYTHWLLSKGFQDLARGTKQMLEEAYFYNGMVERAGGLRTLADVQAAEQELRAAASKKKFPQLLDEIKKQLTSPLHYERELLSLQDVRNCLEHREGIVQERDVDPATGVLHLRWPRLRLFYEDQGRQIELGRGSRVEKDTAVMMNVVVEEREFKLGERVTFNAEEFHDIGFGCWTIANDLVSRLPQLPTKDMAQKNLLAVLSKLNDNDIKHINWWLEGAPCGQGTKSFQQVALLDYDMVKASARKYFHWFDYASSPTRETSEKLFEGKP